MKTSSVNVFAIFGSIPLSFSRSVKCVFGVKGKLEVGIQKLSDHTSSKSQYASRDVSFCHVCILHELYGDRLENEHFLRGKCRDLQPSWKESKTRLSRSLTLEEEWTVFFDFFLVSIFHTILQNRDQFG